MKDADIQTIVLFLRRGRFIERQAAELILDLLSERKESLLAFGDNYCGTCGHKLNWDTRRTQS